MKTPVWMRSINNNKMKFLLILGATIGMSSAGCKDYPAAVEWPATYTVEGEINIPYAEVKEPFQAWYDANANRSRIDYYGGIAKTFQFSDWPTEDGSTISIVPETTEQFLNKISCFKMDGNDVGSVSAQSVLPDMTKFKCSGEGNINGVQAQKWTYSFKIEQKTNKYIMWLTWKNTEENGTAIPVPVLYEMKGYDTLMSSHFDHYYLTYSNFQTISPPHDVWTLPTNFTCDGFPGPGKGLSPTMNPMREFIEGDTSHHDKQWDEFINKHSRKYNATDEAFRKYLFKQNHRFILAHNRADHGYKLAVNHLADRTADELNVLRGRVPSKEDSGNGGLPFPYSGKELIKKHKKLPKQHDWRLFGAVNRVKDQSICGSCWSFGTTGTIEGAYFVKNKELISLSEQALVDCSWGFGNNGCDGGEDFRAYGWIMKHGGIPLEEEYGPYLAVDGMCHIGQVKLYSPIAGFVNVTSRSEEALRVAIFEKGPISVSVDASLKTFSFYSHGVFYDPKCHEDSNDLDHAVLAVGYGTLDGKKYWLIKNSWSNMWGNDGYILMSVENNDCGITTNPTYVILK